MKRTCCFCSHANPARAKFCNECGTPLHLKPCAACDAVNPRSAAACLRCGAALETVAYEAPAPATATDRIMADADDTLAALQRDLALAVRAGASSQDAGTAPAAPAREPDSTPREPEALPLAAAAAGAAASVQDPGTEPFPIIGERRDDSPAERVDVWIDPEAAPARDERIWRPRHGRRVAVVLLALVLFLTPAAFWTQRNPEQVSAWRERVAELFNGSGAPPAQPEASPADASSAPAVATNPSPSPATSEAARAEAPAASGGVEQQAPAADAGAAPATRAEMAEASPPAPTVTPPRESKARSRAAAKSRSTSRTARPARAPATKSAAAPARAAEPCTEAVAALGLCGPQGGSDRP